MNEQSLSKFQGSIIALGPSKDYSQGKRYENIRLRLSETRQTTVRNVIVAAELDKYLSPDATVTMYFIQSPLGDNFLFAVDDGTQRADIIDSIGRDQAQARKHAIKCLLISIPLCLVLIGFVMLVLAIRGLVRFASVPKPADMRAFMAANPPVRQEAAAVPAL